MIYDCIIRGGFVVDGTKRPGEVRDVAIHGDRIAALGPPGTLQGARTIPAEGRHVVPGFIDIHSHADYTILHDGRAHSAVMQGITSIVTGNCGLGIAPVSTLSADMIDGAAFGWQMEDGLSLSWRSFGDYLALLRDRGVGPNVFPMATHGAIRAAVAGFADRPVDRAEIRTMQAHLEEAMKAGAIGFSTGLEYAPGISSTTVELVEFAEAMAGREGVYATHCRNRGPAMEEAVTEAIAIARAGAARLQLSHFIRRPHGSDEILARAWARIHEADSEMSIFADVFPFDYGPTPLSVLLPPALRDHSRSGLAARLKEPSFKTKVMNGLGGMFEAALKNGLVESMYVAADGTDGEFVGLSLAEVARRRKIDTAEAAYFLLENAGENFGTVMIVENWVRWDDLVQALGDPRYFIMGDGATGTLDGPGAGRAMCLSDWGYVPRFLSRFVRDMGICSIEDAVLRMSTGPARQFGLHDRGCLEPGKAADVVVLDLEEVGTNVSPQALKELPSGIYDVLVNGTAVVAAGKVTDACPGIVGKNR